MLRYVGRQVLKVEKECDEGTYPESEQIYAIFWQRDCYCPILLPQQHVYASDVGN